MQNINYAFLLSRPVWGAWIEIASSAWGHAFPGWSRPVWGAWIEIGYQYEDLQLVVGRAPYGARGLKLLIGGAIGIFGRRAPYGARGLKSFRA